MELASIPPWFFIIVAWASFGASFSELATAWLSSPALSGTYWDLILNYLDPSHGFLQCIVSGSGHGKSYFDLEPFTLRYAHKPICWSSSSCLCSTRNSHSPYFTMRNWALLSLSESSWSTRTFWYRHWPFQAASIWYPALAVCASFDGQGSLPIPTSAHLEPHFGWVPLSHFWPSCPPHRGVPGCSPSLVDWHCWCRPGPLPDLAQYCVDWCQCGSWSFTFTPRWWPPSRPPGAQSGGFHRFSHRDEPLSAFHVWLLAIWGR